MAALAAALAALLALVFFGWEEAVGGIAGGVAGGLAAIPVVRGALRRGGTRGGLAVFVALGAAVAAGLAFAPVVGYLELVALPGLALRPARGSPSVTRACARSRVIRAAKPVVLIVIDGLTPSMLEATETPALRFLLEHGSYRRATSTFPSVTPVCLASIATGAHPDVHGIPHLVWWNREEQRLVEYGSSFGALRAAGLVQGVRDSVVNLNERHLSRRAETVYEALEDAGWTTAAINITTYRGRHRHLSVVPGFPPVYGPKRFFFYSVYESDRTGAPIAFLNRALGSIDAYAAAVRRWLVTRDGFDLLVFYLPDYDYALHALGLGAAHEALGRADAAVAVLMDAAGGREAFLERYAVLLCAASTARRRSRRPPGSRCLARWSPPPTGLRWSTATTRGRSRALSPASPRSTSRSSSTAASWWRVAPATRTAPFSTTTPTGTRARQRRCATRTPARCSCRRHRAGSSSTWRATTTPGAAAMVPSRRRTLLVPMLSVGLGEPPGSITEIKARIAAHFGLAVAARAAVRPMSAERRRTGSGAPAASAAGFDDPRMLVCGDGARAPRTPSSHGGGAAEQAYDDCGPARPATARPSRSPSWWPSPAGRGSGCAVAASGCSTSARARAMAPPCSPSSPARSTRSSASRSWPHVRGPRSPATGYADAVTVHVGDGALKGCRERRPVRRAIAVAAASPGRVPPALWDRARRGGPARHPARRRTPGASGSLRARSPRLREGP